jgi:hypothetical protein
MGTWDDPLVTRGHAAGTRAPGGALYRYRAGLARPGPMPGPRPRSGYDTRQPGGAASFLDHRGTWNP